MRSVPSHARWSRSARPCDRPMSYWRSVSYSGGMFMGLPFLRYNQAPESLFGPRPAVFAHRLGILYSYELLNFGILGAKPLERRQPSQCFALRPGIGYR